MSILIGIVFIVSLVGFFFYTHILALRAGIVRPLEICSDSCGCGSSCSSYGSRFYTHEEFRKMLDR